MRKTINLALVILLCALAAPAQKRSAPASEAELAQITERGRQLAAYDRAAWHATDAVLALKPTEGSVARYIARKTDAGWTVVFGRFNDKRDKFLVVYEASQGANPKEFKVKKHEPPKEVTDFYLYAAQATDTALADFRGQNRPYNVAALPTASDQIYVYVVPAPTKAGIWPLGGDVRYLISKDGSKIVEKRQLHNAILEIPPSESGNTVAGFHTAVLDDVPEDTDVFHVLSREPSAPEYVMTEKFVYRIEVDGTIKYLMTAEAFTKTNKPQEN